MRLTRLFHLLIAKIWDGKQMSVNYRLIMQIMELIVMHLKKHKVWHKQNQTSKRIENLKNLVLKEEKNSRLLLIRLNHGQRNIQLLMKFQTKLYQIHMISEI